MQKQKLDEPVINLSDNHCHFHPEATIEQTLKFSNALNNCKYEIPEKFFHVMTTQHIDLECMNVLLEHLQDKNIIVPYFGVHPWFSHLFYMGDVKPNKIDHYTQILKPGPSDELLQYLPDPMSMKKHTAKVMGLIEKYNLKVFGIGEIGLDKLFRVPNAGFLSNPKYTDINETDKLSNSRVKIEHQMSIFRYQLELANHLKKQVSIHCVKAHGILYDEVMNYSDIIVVLHSYTGSIDQAQRWLKTKKKNLYFSLSNWINGEKQELLELLAKNVNDSQILTESDIYIDRYFIYHKEEEYFNHLIGIFTKLNSYKPINSLQLKTNMLNSLSIIE
ncbi:scn1 [Candida jiufengensis]|uniref:scn1 n=1 Tax=Candida jiufengensis TaxID=497108 RepID=UPI00222508C9|nr:scn1 [Candida jiufengensis]KAI5952583.1 scn1 [Candida jiufengensis]